MQHKYLQENTDKAVASYRRTYLSAYLPYIDCKKCSCKLNQSHLTTAPGFKLELMSQVWNAENHWQLSKLWIRRLELYLLTITSAFFLKNN